MLKLKKSDQVKVMRGKDRGKTGKIEKIFPQKRMVLLPGINIAKKHVKPRGEGQPGGIVDVARPLSMAKVALVCPKCGRPTRVGFKLEREKGKKRFCRKCQQVI